MSSVSTRRYFGSEKQLKNREERRRRKAVMEMLARDVEGMDAVGEVKFVEGFKRPVSCYI